MDHGQENTGLPDFSQYNSTSMSSVMSILSPTTLPAKLVAEVFPISESRPSRRSTSTAVGSGSDGSGRWYYNCPELSMEFFDSPFSRFCTGHCRTNNLLYLQQPHLGDKADVVRFLYWFPFYICTWMLISRIRFVSRLLKTPNGLGKLLKDPRWLR